MKPGICAILAGMVQSQTYSAQESSIDGLSVIRLRGPGETCASLLPSLGCNVFELTVNGKNAIWFPYPSPGEFAVDSAPEFCGTPFLAPWANRLDEHSFYANGTRFELDRGLGNYLTDDLGQPIHGLLWRCPHWSVERLEATDSAAIAQTRLEFGAHGNLMAQFPFEHRIDLSFRLGARQLEVRTAIRNTGRSPMPVSVGFHPYFRLHDSARDRWRVCLAANSVWDLDARFIPTGERTPIGEVFANPSALRLSGEALDHVFGDLRSGSTGTARFSVAGHRERLEVVYGTGYPAAVVYAPQGHGREFICFEPMSGITNAFNLAHKGKFAHLPVIAPGESWHGVFSVLVSGF